MDEDNNEIIFELYDELEDNMKNKPLNFSQMQSVANNISRLEELEEEHAKQHSLIIFLLIYHHFVNREGKVCKNKLPYNIDIIGRKRNKGNSSSSSENEDNISIKCVIEKLPPILQKILLAYTVLYIVKE